MARRREDVDWYVEMSEMLERRERRRRWVILAAAVALPLLLMAVLVSAAVITKIKQRGGLAWLRWPVLHVATERTAAVEPETYEPVAVKSLEPGDIIYSQLDRNGFVTSISHFFRELGPNPQDAKAPFVVERDDEYAGRIQLYRLRNVGTGEVFEFRGLAVKRIAAGEWIITEDGYKQIRNDLQARMRVQVRRIGGR